LISGLLERCAQSKGECPGVNRTFCRSFVGIAVRLGGGARDEFDITGGRFGRADRGGGEARGFMERKGGWATRKGLNRGGPRPPEARWIEFVPGNNDDVGLSFIVKLGKAEALSATEALVSLETVEVVDAEETRNEGGGGGIALRSRSAFLSSSCVFSSLDLESAGGGAAMFSLL
jgi:hypothetical protein